MWKVFLVEDEIVMREGIKNNIQWEKEGFKFVGEASDGELAYPLIQKTKPDILITDIQMPFMNGLELSRLVKQEMPDIKIILLSGYDEFEYAKEAINIGIASYLVKPIASVQLLEEVKKVGRSLEEERQQREVRQTFELDTQEDVQLAKQKFFRKLVSGKQSIVTLLKDGQEIGLDLTANQYNIILFQIFDDSELAEYSEVENEVTTAIEDMTEEMPNVLMVELGLEGWAFVLMEFEGDDLEKMEKEFLSNLEATLLGYEKIGYFGGVGQAVGRLSELNRCFEEANRAFAYRYLKDRNQIIYSGETESEDAKLQLSHVNVGKLDRKVVDSFLKTGLRGETTHFVDEYFASLGEPNVQSLLFRQYVTMDMYFAAVSMLESLGYKSDELVERCGDFQAMTAVFSSTEETKNYLKKILETAVELREAVSRKKYATLLKDARAYIEQNYQNEDISLNRVAASVNLSPNHFSTIFRQETGMTFIDCLTNVRMEKAKELLRTTSMKSAEIAFAVGYKDPHYFSFLFKKTQECTPREFRTRN